MFNQCLSNVFPAQLIGAGAADFEQPYIGSEDGSVKMVTKPLDVQDLLRELEPIFTHNLHHLKRRTNQL